MARTLPTCSGVFFRLHCRHQTLFEKEYKRCFPHCCPSHVERSYCGSSLELAVEMHQPMPVDANSLFVFARFETVDLETALVVGEHYSLRHLMSVSQSEANPEATWIQGVMQNRAASSSKPTTRVFLLNGQTSSKWYYHWESGANKARRLTKHVLKAYILYRRPSGGAPQDLVQVISTVCSPQFTLVSYRRAAWEGLEGMEGSGYPADVDHADYDLNEVVQEQISQAFHDFQKQSGSDGGLTPAKIGAIPSNHYKLLDNDEGRRQRNSFQGAGTSPLDQDELDDDDDDRDGEGECVCESCAHYRQARPPSANTLVRTQWIWERQHTAMTLHMKDLAIVYYFLSNVPMVFAMQSFRVREHVYTAMQNHWSDNESATREPGRLRSSRSSLRQPAVLLSLIFPSRDGVSTAAATAHSLGVTSTSSGAGMSSQVENLLLVVAKLSIWLLSKENIMLFQDFFDAHASVVLQKHSLRDAFLHFAGLLCKRVQIFWSQEVKTPSSDSSPTRDTAFKVLRTMSELIISLSHSHARFQSLWPDLRDILEAPGTIMWESFISQMRETLVRKQPQQLRMFRSKEPRRALTTLDGCWVIDASTAYIDRASISSQHGTTKDHDTPTISATLAMMGQLQRVYMRVTGSETLLVRSECSLLPDQNPWMTLVCDGLPRTASSLPIGLSSLIGSQVFGGDYLGTVNHARSTILLELYWWPLRYGRSHRGAQATRLLLTLQHQSAASALDLTVELQQGAIAKSEIEREKLSRMDLWSPKERLDLCVGWATTWKASVTYVHADDDTKPWSL